jgi:predicted TIM-barrel fold metal-dependent hydrolase
MHKIIDPHLHLFNLELGEYTWLKPSEPPLWPDKSIINQSFSESDLTLPASIQLAGFVHIEAGFDNQKPYREIDWLEQHCSLPFKSVAFADLTSAEFTQDIQQLTKRKSVTGIRHILDEDAVAILSTSSIHQHFALLEEHQLSFDVQMLVCQQQATEKLIKLAQLHPQLKIIINHAGWPPINQQSTDYKQWLMNLAKLAECTNIAIKLSAWEMTKREWEVEYLHQILLDCLVVFGRTRVMLASNFPLCLFTKSYADLWRVYTELADIIDADCFAHITYTTAANWYNLKIVTNANT